VKAPRRRLPRQTARGVDELEPLIFMLSIGGAVAGAVMHSQWRMHRLYFRGNAAPGIVRAGVILAMAWIWFVLLYYADPSVTGFYVLFYLVMGYAVVKLFGQATIANMGARSRQDVIERRNVPAALVAMAFILATGLIFGGSLWGEADPVADDEGGWWIPVAFFLLGWGALLVAFALFRRRERRTLAHRIRRDRSLGDARATAAFLLASGVTLTDAVSGDFWGWAHGLVTFGVLAGMLLAHEAFAGLARGRQPGDDERGEARRVLESITYLALALLAWVAFRAIDVALRTA
jgi:hypothetical protein